MDVKTEVLSRGIVFGSSRKSHGNMSLCYGPAQDSVKNRRVFLSELGIDYRALVCAKQVHSDKIRYVTPFDSGKGALVYDTAIEDTDALITDHPGLPLSIFSADCLVVFLFDPVKRALGLVHAGWRGTKQNIAAKTVGAMQERFSVDPRHLHAMLSPAIRSCCYEVGKEIRDFFPEYVIEREGRLYLDLAKANKNTLLASGIKEENIFDSMVCTACNNDEFYSYRKEKDSSGRMMSVAMLIS
ncbi:MAG: peptidoglycan editing factor PgeF [Candidatus Omnitrophica bacterium]|nr:peptidoglycan editing factor PgeF [Candidatus Omnitrophota bacterium]